MSQSTLKQRIKKLRSLETTTGVQHRSAQGHPKECFGKLFVRMECPLKLLKTFAKRYPRLSEAFGKPSTDQVALEFYEIMCSRFGGNSHNFRMVFLSPKIFVRRNYSKRSTLILILINISNFGVLYPCLFNGRGGGGCI